METYLNFGLEFLTKHKELKDRQPYHINLIDELNANENAHSRILKKILEYQKNGKYSLFESFINYIKKIEHESFSKICVDKPRFTAEKQRIDVCIKDSNYCLIIENKIHWACDQDKQIDRYVKISQDEKISIDKIFVLYLTRTGGSPSDNSLSEAIRCNLGGYAEINYQQHIIPWLEKDVLPFCQFKDVYLISAIQQYIDHLQGLFDQRIIDKEMEAELKTHIIKELNLCDQPMVRYRKLQESIVAMNKTREYLVNMRYESMVSIFRDWDNEIKGLGYVSELYHNPNKIELVIPFEISYLFNKKFSCNIKSEDTQTDRIIYGIVSGDEEGIFDKDVIDFLKGLNIGKFKETGNWWYVRKETTIEEFKGSAFDEYLHWCKIINEKVNS